jgi:hypothetical protein
MTVVRHQTIKLSRGRHDSPDEGACVMELASILAGDEFSDRPVSVCPAIAAFLTQHNDSIDDERRQDLYAYAAKVVGSRSPGPVQDERATRLTAWDSAVRQRQSTESNVPWLRRALNRMLNAMFEEIPSYAFYGLTVHNDDTHAEVLAFVEELLAIKPGRSGLPAASVGQKPAVGPSRRLRSGRARSQAVGSL